MSIPYSKFVVLERADQHEQLVTIVGIMKLKSLEN